MKRKRSRRFFKMTKVELLFIMGSSSYTCLGLLVALLFRIQKCQDYLLTFSLSDGFLLASEPYFFYFVVAMPYLVLAVVRLGTAYPVAIILQKPSRAAIWREQLGSLLLGSLIWLGYVTCLIAAVVAPFVFSSNDWQSVSSYFYYTVGTTSTISFIKVYLLWSLRSGLVFFLLDIMLLLFYWCFDEPVSALLGVFFLESSLMVSSISFLISYNSFANFATSVIKSLLFLVCLIVLAKSITRSSLIRRKEYYKGK